MSEPSVLIYAELLSNIRQISVIAALDTPCDASTKVELSSNGQQFILNHKGKTTTLNLPGQVSSRAQLQNPTLGSKELSWRLPVEGVFTREDAENARSNDGPWSAKTLGEESEFLCRSCDSVVIKEKTIKIWKDLPSENWAEMMDFWHCHKPDDHEDEHEHEVNGASGHTKIRQAGKSSTEKVSDSNANRGYGANTKFTAQTGIGFVDLTTFLLLDTDCLGLQLSGHRYKYPKLISYCPSGRFTRRSCRHTLFLGRWVTCLVCGSQARSMPAMASRDLENHGICYERH
ncbi:HECT-like ubiquitin-conjugating enzyme-binding-domain-containing protein [Halenospora varia]|nr:HECT-like ubiquitin-conjugating enzyme-binding-domain-containing protein [Halenospora varia]